MPTDDDYGQRKRLLLHQHPIPQFETSTTSATSGKITTNPNLQNTPNSPNMVTNGTNTGGSLETYHRASLNPSESSSPSSKDDNEERYQISCGNSENERSQANQLNDYGIRIANQKYGKQDEKQQQSKESSQYVDQSRSTVSYCERMEMAQSQEKFNHSSLTSENLNHVQFTKQHQSMQQGRTTVGYTNSSTEQRISFPQSEVRSEYANSDILTLSASIKPFPTDSFPSPPSPAPANDRFIPPPALPASPNGKRSTTRNLCRYPSDDCVMPPGSPSSRDRYANDQPTTMLKDRFSSSERLLGGNNSVNAPNVHENHEHQHRYCSSNERLLNVRSPVLMAHQRDSHGISLISNSAEDNGRYTMSTERLVSPSPIHANVPEKFMNKPNERFITNSPKHDRYQWQDSSSAVGQDRYPLIASSDKFLSDSSNHEETQIRYASTERILNVNTNASQSRRYSSSDRGTDNQKRPDRNDRCSSPPVVGASDFLCTYSGMQDASSQSRYSTDRYNDHSRNRYSQSSRGNDRYNEHSYFSCLSPTNHDNRAGSESVKYFNTSSTERLYISSSPPMEQNRYHNVSSSPGPTSNERFHQLSPTPDTHHNYQSESFKQNDKFIPNTKSSSNYDRYQITNEDQSERSSQDRGYGYERYGNVSNGNDRYHGNEQRLHGSAERYSPARNVGDKYLSLANSKETMHSGRLASSCSPVTTGNDNRNYSNSMSLGTNSYVPPNAHTPVERYVPQPPSEVFYSERYADRYMPSTAHTPTDRYVPAVDPVDPYMRRDLGFHHHYRLPPPSYAFHQSHFRFRGFPYTSPARIGGSPGSSSSSSSTSAQREFSTSPLLRPKVRASTVEFTSTGRSSHACCSDISNRQRCCCSVRRSLPPGALPSISSNQSTQSSWQQSPSSTTTGTSTISSGTDGESSQSLNMYTVGNRSGNTATEESTLTVPAISPSTPSISTATMNTNNAAGSTITRSISAPASSRPNIHAKSSSNITAISTGQIPRVERHMSRTEAIKDYIKKETATFFGVNEETENREKQKWLERRRRMAARKYGALLSEHKTPDPDITKDIPDSSEVPEGSVLRRLQQSVNRKESVVLMTLSGIHYIVETITRHRLPENPESQQKSRSFPPRVRIRSISKTDVNSASNPARNKHANDEEEEEEEETFFRRPLRSPPSPSLLSTTEADQQLKNSLNENTETDEKNEEVGASAEKLTENHCHITDHLDISDHHTRARSWRRPRHGPKTDIGISVPSIRHQFDGATARSDITGGSRIASNLIDRIFDNSNRRQYGMGFVGRLFGRSYWKSSPEKSHDKEQLDHIEDHRPYFTYWITTVQVLVLIISLFCYGFGPIGIDINHRSGLVLVTSLSLQQVDYQEPANFWIGPRAADLIHLGAKFAPCMRRDIKILKEIDVWRERERDTACCIRNDDSGCVQSSKADCSIRGLRSTVTNTISTWKKWGPGDNGPGGRISGSVCGLDPKFCDAPASIAPYEWPDDITKWPICRKINPFSQRFRSNYDHLEGNSNFPVGRYKDKMAEHMVCEVIGHPCCIGIHGMCRITTKEYCDFVHGYFHEEASLCSQVECLHDVCGMLPFFHPEWPDQFYRLFSTIFLHAGILHLTITLLVQYYLMKDLEKLTGSIRIGFIYFTGALAGNLASAIFIPYQAEVGPAGGHFALLATLVVEVLNSWPMLKYPRRALSKLIIIGIGYIMIGVLPWVDNYAHIFGFIFGFISSYAMMPFISFGLYERRRKILLIWICFVLIFGFFILLLTLFYSVPFHECEICKLLNCIPFTPNFCASQNIDFKREEPV